MTHQQDDHLWKDHRLQLQGDQAKEKPIASASTRSKPCLTSQRGPLHPLSFGGRTRWRWRTTASETALASGQRVTSNKLLWTCTKLKRYNRSSTNSKAPSTTPKRKWTSAILLPWRAKSLHKPSKCSIKLFKDLCMRKIQISILKIWIRKLKTYFLRSRQPIKSTINSKVSL